MPLRRTHVAVPSKAQQDADEALLAIQNVLANIPLAVIKNDKSGKLKAKVFEQMVCCCTPRSHSNRFNLLQQHTIQQRFPDTFWDAFKRALNAPTVQSSWY